MPIGTVKWFNNQKGYGFISQVDGPDVFAHYTAIAGEGFRTLKEGEEVEFEITEGPKGPQAANIQRKGMSTTPVSLEEGGGSVDDGGEVSDAPETFSEGDPVDEDVEAIPEEDL